MLISSTTSLQSSALENSHSLRNIQNLRFLQYVSRETFLASFRVFSIFLALVWFAGCGEDSISEDVSGINRVLSSQYDIKSAEHLAKFYYEYLYSNPNSKLSIEIFPQTHNRVKIVLTDVNPSNGSMFAEKFEIIAKQNETTWKIVVVNRNWKCRPKGETGEWGIEACD